MRYFTSASLGPKERMASKANLRHMADRDTEIDRQEGRGEGRREGGRWGDSYNRRACQVA